MKTLRGILKLIRRILLGAFALAFALSFAMVFSAQKYTHASPALTEILSVNGKIGFISYNPMGISQANQRWHVMFFALAHDQPGRKYDYFFKPSTLGFELMFPGHPPTIHLPSPRSSFFILVVPYWALLLVLLIPEFFLLIRRLRTQILHDKPPASETPIDSASLLKDMPCVHCGYNLRSLHVTARCPECGSPVLNTVSLNAELAKSRPLWLRFLAAGNALLLLARIFLIFIYATLITNAYYYAIKDSWQVAVLAVAMAISYSLGIIFLTLREHPFLKPPDRRAVFTLRFLAAASFLCVTAGMACVGLYAAAFSPSRGYSPTRWFWPMIPLLILGWLFYCVCVVLEYRYLARLAGRLLDRFMTEHCKIAGIGAAITSLLILPATPCIIDKYNLPHAAGLYAALVALIVLWVLFLTWTSFMNLYCALRFLQQSHLATARWRSQQPTTVPQ